MLNGRGSWLGMMLVDRKKMLRSLRGGGMR